MNALTITDMDGASKNGSPPFTNRLRIHKGAILLSLRKI